MSSEANNANLDITVVASGVPPELPGGPELAALAQKLTTNTDDDPISERQDLVSAIGSEGAERAIGVCATFQTMNRLLDGTGAPVGSWLYPVARELGFEPEDITR